MNNNEIKKKVAIYCRLACKDNEEIKKQEKMLLDIFEMGSKLQRD